MTSAKKTTATANKPYHHGNLRDALIIAAAELIEENASVEFTMIDAARRAGVSSAAPYRHFKDKDALLQEVGLLGFLALTEFVQKEAKNFSPGTEEDIIALGRGYIAFVTNHPQFYDLMWGDMGLRGLDFTDQEVKTSGFHDLVESVGLWCDKMSLSHYNALELAIKLWAMAHGLACLAMNQHLEKFIPDVDVTALLESTTHVFLEGLRGETLD